MELVCLDIETTGFDPIKDQIIEFAAVKFDGGSILGEFSALTNPGIPIPHIVSTITGIKNEDVEKEKPFSDYIEKLREFIGDCPIVGHNINFDTGFLKSKGMDFDNKEIDTLELSTSILSNQNSYSLESLCQSFNIIHKNKHRALDDVLANIELLKILIQKIKDISNTSLENISYYLSKSNWDGKDLFFEELKARKKSPKPISKKNLALKKSKATENDDAADIDITVEEIFSETGPLPKIFGDNFEKRESQKIMANAVFNSFKNKTHLICEAGTGTGKSLGYLLPAAMFALTENKKIIVSTYTNNLQDQLAEKDMPLTESIVSEITKSEKNIKSCILKGRNHYISLHRFGIFLEKDFFENSEIVAVIKFILWLENTSTGDKKEIELRGKENHVWNEICCHENFCPHEEFGDTLPCFLLKNRQAAKHADIVITNHSLLLQDCLSDSPILPSAQNIIIDEAHNLEEVATKSFSEILVISGFESVLDKIRKLLKMSAFKKTNSSNINLFGEATKGQKLNTLIESCDEIHLKLENTTSIAFGLLGIFLNSYLDPFAKYQNDIIINDQKTDNTNWERVKDAFDSLSKINIQALTCFIDLKKEYQKEENSSKKDLLALQTVIEKLTRLEHTLQRFFKEDSENIIMWGNISTENHPYLKIAPIKIGPYLKKNLFENKDSVILTSATLSVSHNFGFLKNQLEINENLEEIILPSPFFYSEQCKIVLVEDIPSPSEHGHFQAVCDTLREIILEKKGRMLVLLTSKNAIMAVYKQLFDFCKDEGVNLYAQGISGGRGKILQNFRNNHSNSVILGLNSFWEGIDLPGDMLTSVIIQKLPFDPPSDPLHSARGNLAQNSFMDYSVPRAILRFKQGFGRLIRSTRDSGVLTILDSRITNKKYGQTFLASLPEGIPIIHTSKKDIRKHLHHK